MRRVVHFIGDKLTEGSSKRIQDIFNPALGEKKGEVILGTSEDVKLAIEKANQIFPTWANTPPVRRARIIFKFLELVKRDKEKLAKVITSELS